MSVASGSGGVIQVTASQPIVVSATVTIMMYAKSRG